MSATAHSAPTAHVRRPYRALRFTRDEELVRLLRAGDERAFEALYDRHNRGILAFCRHMLGSAEEAEDTVQHTFIAAHRDLVGTDKPMQLKAWLYTVARNRCLSVLRARKEERALEDVPEPSVRGLAAEVQQREDLRDLLADLQRLPEDQRAALVLSELGALSHEEIGATLGVRKDKVKALVFQARESLASSRGARDADCREIQEQLSVLRGGSLRRTTLRRHVEVCPACAAFKAEVKLQRGAMAAILPVVPSLALKESVMAAIFGGGAAGGGIIGGGLLAAGGTKALVAKVATIAAVAGGATGGGLVAVDEISNDGEGNTATAMAGIPAGQQSVQMVGALRQRAERTAEERAADRRPAATGAGSPSAAADGDVASTETGRTRRARAERRGKPVHTAGARGAAEPVSVVAPEQPVAPAVRVIGSAPKQKAEKDKDSGGRSSDEGERRKRNRGARSSTAVKIKKTDPGIASLPGDAQSTFDRPKRKATRAVTGHVWRPKKGPPLVLPEQVPAHLPQQGSDGRERGGGKGGDRGDAKKAYAAATVVVNAVTEPPPTATKLPRP